MGANCSCGVPVCPLFLPDKYFPLHSANIHFIFDLKTGTNSACCTIRVTRVDFGDVPGALRAKYSDSSTVGVKSVLHSYLLIHFYRIGNLLGECKAKQASVTAYVALSMTVFIASFFR